MRAVLATLLSLSASTCSPAPTALTDATANPGDRDQDAASDLGSEAAKEDLPELDLGSGPRDPSAWSPRAPGPFHVGYRTWRRTYTPAGTSAPRTINVHVWYPTLAATGAPATYFGFFRDRESFVDAAVAPPSQPEGYPVHVYSHGDRGFAGTSAFLMRWFASHGWVSVAPDHTGNTLGDTPMVRPPSLYFLRSRDVSSALDALRSPEAPGLIAERAVTLRAVLSGHSFGTHTVWASLGASFDPEACARAAAPRCSAEDLGVFSAGVGDPRFVAGIPMAGALSREWFGPMGHRSVRAPMLAMSGTDDPVGAEAQFTTTQGVDLGWVEVRGACHQFFALSQNLCMNIPDALQGPIVGGFALAFARRHVLGDSSPEVSAILDGTTALSDRVTLHRR